MITSRSRRPGLVLAVALTTLVSSTWWAPPAQAAGEWLPPHDLFAAQVSHIHTDPARDRPALQVREDGAGNAVAAWVQDVGGICQAEWASRPFGGTWSKPRELAPPMASCPLQHGLALAMNKQGAAVAAWDDATGVVAALRPAGGTFGSPKAMSAVAFASDPAAAIDGSGTVAVAWVEHSFTIGQPSPLKARVRPAGAAFGPVEPITTADSAFSPSLAIDTHGNVLALWAQTRSVSLSSTAADVLTAVRPVGGPFPTTPTQTLDSWAFTTGSPVFFAPDVVADADGGATAVWTLDTGTQQVVRSAAKIAGTTQFGTILTVNPGDTGSSRMPRVALDPRTNTAVVVWLQCASTTCTVESGSRPSGGAFGDLQTLSGALSQTDMMAPAIASSPNGTTMAAWSGAASNSDPDRTFAARRPHGGSFGSGTSISGSAGTADDNGPAPAMDGRGNAVVVWVRSDGTPAALARYADFLGSRYRPDGLIKRATDRKYLGANVVNTTGAHQLVSAKVHRGHSVVLDIKAVNRASVPDRILVKGAGAKAGFSVAYFAGASGTRAITKAVVHGTYTLKLAPGRAAVFRLVVSGKAGTAVGTADFWPVTLRSQHDAGSTDVVKASVTVVS